MRQVAIYMLTDPTGAHTNYVGRSINPDARLQGHLYDALGNPGNPKSRWITMLRNRGLKPTLTVLDYVPESEAVQAETDAIRMSKAIRGADCLNVICGG